MTVLWQFLGGGACLIPEEVKTPSKFNEGATKTIMVNVYERNPAARRKCIAHYGSQCVACGFDFGAFYDGLGEGYIHVHHLKPLAEIGEEYEVDPVVDLRPVCPNCHAVIHLTDPPMTIEEVTKRILRRGDVG